MDGVGYPCGRPVHRLLASPFVRGFLGACAAVICLLAGLVIVHLWSDHQALHTLVNYLNANAIKINKLP